MPRLLLCFFLLLPLAAASPCQQQTPQNKSTTTAAQQHLEDARSDMLNGHWHKVEGHLKKARRLAPKNPEIYQLYGDFHSAFNRAHKARKFYARAQALQAENTRLAATPKP